MSGIELICAGSTDSGRIRKVNEDDFLVDKKLSLFAVADGLGGHGSGNVASSLAIETLQEELQSGIQSLSESDLTNSDVYISIVTDAIRFVNRTIYERNKAKGYSDGSGMATTLVGVCFFSHNESFVSFNVGDSRLYRSKDGTLEQSTKDHSLLQEWHDMGGHGIPPAANLLKRAVGLFPEIEADLLLHATRTDEILMLCSDGLTSMLEDHFIGNYLATYSDQGLDTVCSDLIDSANAQGGEDNITVIAVQT